MLHPGSSPCPSLPACPPLVAVESPAAPTQNHSSPQIFCRISCCLSLCILQVCRPLEHCQVYGRVLPRVRPSGQGREAFLVPSLLLQERPGPSQLPDQEGSSTSPGEAVGRSSPFRPKPLLASFTQLLSELRWGFCKLERCSWG